LVVIVVPAVNVGGTVAAVFETPFEVAFSVNRPAAAGSAAKVSVVAAGATTGAAVASTWL
jgi:hypothetical protein